MKNISREGERLPLGMKCMHCEAYKTCQVIESSKAAESTIQVLLNILMGCPGRKAKENEGRA